MAENEFPKDIDLIIYINLDHRIDRRCEIEAEFERLGIRENQVLRWPATRNQSYGTLGCVDSHIAALKYVASLPESVKTILILEDDFNFIDNKEQVYHSLHTFLRYPRDTWDVALLSYSIEEREDYNDLVSLVFKSYKTSGYLTARNYVPMLIANFEEGRHLLNKTHEHWHYAIDVHWWSLMKNRRWFYFNIPLGYQRRSYSELSGNTTENLSYVASHVVSHKKPRFPDQIDLVAYINLDRRTDRRKEIENELDKAGVSRFKILRWEATSMPDHPALGCTTSHVTLLRHLMTLPDSIKTILILEDDFTFNSDMNMVHQSLTSFLSYPREQWEVALLSYYIRSREDYNDLVSIALRSLKTDAYMVKREFLANLLDNFEKSQCGLRKTRNLGLYGLDIFWSHLMKSEKWFYFNNPLGHQRESYSVVDHSVKKDRSMVALD